MLLRTSGKRTLSKLNAFDLVVTVALGSTLATVILSRTVRVVNGVAALAALVALQYLVAWASLRSRRIARLVKSEPRALFFRGTFAREAMRDERIAGDEVLAAVRRASVGTLDEVEAVILEASGDLAVIRKSGAARGSRELDDVRLDGVPSRDARDPRA